MEYFKLADSSLIIVGNYSIWLVSLSIVIAVFASYSAYKVASVATATKSNVRRHISLIVGSLALGGGVWSMHFIGMLAFELCTDIRYDPTLSVISLFPSFFASWIALSFLTKPDFKIYQLLVSGTLMGLGIGTMHYVGMASMEMTPLLRYDLPIFIISIIVAAVFACLSLWCKFSLKILQKFNIGDHCQTLIASTFMGIAISGMHYTGMAAARFVLPPGMEQTKQTYEISFYLATLVSVITFGIIVLVLIVMMLFKVKDISSLASKNEKRLAAMINTSQDGIITFDQTGTIIGLNNAMEEILGWSEDELVSKHIKTLFDHSVKALTTDALNQFLMSYQSSMIGKTNELNALNKEGQEVPVKLSLGHIALEEQDLFVGYVSDLRFEYKLRQDLKDNEQKLKSLVSNIPGIVYRCVDDDKREMEFISPEVKTITGYSFKDFLIPNPKQNFADLIFEEDLAKIIESSVLEDQQFKLEYRIKNKYGDIKWLFGTGRKFKDIHKDTSYIDGFIMDITERKKMEDALRQEMVKAQQAAETRAEFMANMSHEIRTPMNAIIGFSSLLLEEDITREQRRHISTIHESAESLLYILNDVLDSAKMDRGELAIENQAFSITSTMDSIISSLGLQAQKKNIEIKLTVAKNIPLNVFGSQQRIRQVLLNIIGNAVKFTHEGYVHVSLTTKQKDCIAICITDTGIGMSAEQVAKVFDPFTQADASMSRKYGGTGLGTTIAKQLVELMDGTIDVTSTLGKGTTMNIELPLPQVEINPFVEETALFASSNDTQDLWPHDRTLNILIVDDVAQNLDLLRLICEKQGHEVIQAMNGKQALAKMEEHTFDVIIMDVQMPVMDGLTAAIERRKYEYNNNIKRLPIIALTASVLENDRIAARGAGMDGFANKPIIPSLLFKEIELVLSMEDTDEIEANNESNATSDVINTKQAISLWGDKLTYIRELDSFLSSNDFTSICDDACQEATSAIEFGKELHRLRGIAGNLGLNALGTFFQDAEHKCNTLGSNASHVDETDTLNVISLLSQYDKHMQNITDEANKLKERMSVKHTPPKQEISYQSESKIIEILYTLKEQVKQNTFDDDILEQGFKFVPELYTHDFGLLVDKCNDFEFDEASLILEGLINLIEKK